MRPTPHWITLLDLPQAEQHLARLEAEFKAAGGRYADSLRWIELTEQDIEALQARIAFLKEN